jgi:hypothetical protein
MEAVGGEDAMFCFPLLVVRVRLAVHTIEEPGASACQNACHYWIPRSQVCFTTVEDDVLVGGPWMQRASNTLFCLVSPKFEIGLLFRNTLLG